MKKHYLVYQITNLINEKIYIGIHITESVGDGYMGSGRRVRKAIKKYGLENFKKEILFDFDNPEEMIAKEAELVDRTFIARKDVYNIACGGYGWNNIDTIAVRDENGNCFRVNKTDERWLNGTLKSVETGKITVVDSLGNLHRVYTDDIDYLSGKLKHILNTFKVVKDKSGKVLTVKEDDERVLAGELVPIWKDRKHKEETKKRIGVANSLAQAGDRNSQYGTCWVVKNEVSKKINKLELDSYLQQGWMKGRKIKI